MRKILIAFFAVHLMFTGAALADDFEASLDKARAAYKAGNFAEARAQLEVALQSLDSSRSGQLEKYFPPAPAGFTAGKPESESVPLNQMVGNTIRRQYSKGDDTIEVTFVDGGMAIQQVAAMLTSPMIAASGKKLEVIGGEKAMVTNDDGNKEVQLVLNGKLMITVSSSTLSIEQVLGLAKAIDYAKLKAAL